MLEPGSRYEAVGGINTAMARQAGYQSDAKLSEPTILDTMSKRLAAITGDIQSGCNRLDQTLQRLDPHARPETGADNEGPPHGALGRLNRSLDELERTARWLHQLAAAMEKIA